VSNTRSFLKKNISAPKQKPTTVLRRRSRRLFRLTEISNIVYARCDRNVELLRKIVRYGRLT